MKYALLIYGDESLQPAEGSPELGEMYQPETKEQLGGFYLVDVADLDAAIAVAARIPGAQHGTIEVRPIVSFE